MLTLLRLWKMNTIAVCSTCKGRHKVYDDGFDYLSCMLYLKWDKNKEPQKVGVISPINDKKNQKKG